MGIALKKAGFDDFVILDKGDDLGGTWRDNQYPGCACDVPSPLYSYSFELNPSWSRLFAPQQEIWDYLRMCARKHRVDEHIRYGCTVERMDWDDDTRRWTIVTVEHGEVGSYQARAVVSAAGALHLPSYPDIPGAEQVRRHLVPLGALGSLLRSDGQAGRGDRDRRVRDPVHPGNRQAGRAPDRVPAHAAVGPSPARRGDPGPAAGHLQRGSADRPRVPRRHLPADGGQGARLRGAPEADGPAGADGHTAPARTRSPTPPCGPGSPRTTPSAASGSCCPPPTIRPCSGRTWT